MSEIYKGQKIFQGAVGGSENEGRTEASESAREEMEAAVKKRRS